MNGELALFIAALVGAGLFAGFIGGLFGIGGGVVIVPALYYVFTALGVDEAVRMHVSIGTALSTIISTSWRSLSTHMKAGAVDFAAADDVETASRVVEQLEQPEAAVRLDRVAQDRIDGGERIADRPELVEELGLRVDPQRGAILGGQIGDANVLAVQFVRFVLKWIH